MIQTRLFLYVVLISTTTPLYSDNLDCLSITMDVDRLNCYDKKASIDSLETTSHIEGIPALPRDHFKSLTTRKVFLTTPYEPIYFMPVSYNSQPHNAPFDTSTPLSLDENEVKFQISTRIKVTENLFSHNGDVWFGYTQKTFWQLYNTEESAPFRETNYRPEFWLAYETNYTFLGLTARSIDIGITHESNGRGQDLSRSWNKVFLRLSLEREHFAMIITPWFRLEEDIDDDDNPNIENLIGKGEIRLYYATGEHSLVANIRNNFDFDDNSGSVELNWVFPFSGRLKGIVQYFNGYGESLLEYNYRLERFSVGLVLSNWM